MAEAYNVRSNGARYYVYRIDGNVQVAEYFTGSEAQRDAAIRNMRYNEEAGKKKRLEAEQSAATTEPVNSPSVDTSPDQAEAPDPPPGQGASYQIPPPTRWPV